MAVAAPSKPADTGVQSVLHLTKDVRAPVAAVFAVFKSAKPLSRWYDANAGLTAFRVGGKVSASYFPGTTLWQSYRTS